MFGLFKNKIKEKEIIISNIGFHSVFNYCRETYDHRIHDDFSDGLYVRIIKKLQELVNNESSDDLLFDAILNEFEIISPNGSPRTQFKEVAKRICKHTNKLRGKEFDERRKLIKESRFNKENIDETIRMAKENNMWTTPLNPPL